MPPPISESSEAVNRLFPQACDLFFNYLSYYLSVLGECSKISGLNLGECSKWCLGECSWKTTRIQVWPSFI